MSVGVSVGMGVCGTLNTCWPSELTGKSATDVREIMSRSKYTPPCLYIMAERRASDRSALKNLPCVALAVKYHASRGVSARAACVVR